MPVYRLYGTSTHSPEQVTPEHAFARITYTAEFDYTDITQYNTIRERMEEGYVFIPPKLELLSQIAENDVFYEKHTTGITKENLMDHLQINAPVCYLFQRILSTICNNQDYFRYFVSTAFQSRWYPGQSNADLEVMKITLPIYSGMKELFKSLAAFELTLNQLMLDPKSPLFAANNPDIVEAVNKTKEKLRNAYNRNQAPEY